ncbi:hypothetical protein PENANT_c023G08639 [Penicillium antarcticum]|uniref:Uncharacterized protein n=1 Tax=Penicillium antarcticum TaxID=416450 RepID=A0A1V6PYF9_9EURO|nr:uncharacterized protein N7508_006279 [Penicillium antarcticum]KAJ5301416.1 hypothetical protein N7508_006279 [Penicillium antarcticum]OQD82049.1 hypothetical protein PENANT_c023G08639 [Penicillium antarcticum]
MTSSAPSPFATAIPNMNYQREPPKTEEKQTQISLTKPKSKTLQPQPKLRLHVEDLRHPASSIFLAFIPDIGSTLDTALSNIIKHLYTSPKPESEANTFNPSRPAPHTPHFTPSIPSTRSVTVFLRDYSGVAYTTGTELDDAHKEIHVSLPYVQYCTSKDNPLHELVGVLTHELVHCYQHTAPPPADDKEGDGEGDDEGDIPRPPGGLIEGIADFVRLKSGLEPPHWKKPQSKEGRSEKWDSGYQHTAFFLAWLEDVRVGKGAVGMLNDRLLRVGYVGEDEEGNEAVGGRVGFWRGLFGTGVADLWEEYGCYLDDPACAERAGGNWEDEIVNPE